MAHVTQWHTELSEWPKDRQEEQVSAVCAVVTGRKALRRELAGLPARQEGSFRNVWPGRSRRRAAPELTAQGRRRLFEASAWEQVRSIRCPQATPE